MEEDRKSSSITWHGSAVEPLMWVSLRAITLVLLTEKLSVSRYLLSVAGERLAVSSSPDRFPEPGLQNVYSPTDSGNALSASLRVRQANLLSKRALFTPFRHSFYLYQSTVQPQLETPHGGSKTYGFNHDYDTPQGTATCFSE